MQSFERISFDPNVMGGHACICGKGISVSTLVGLLAEGASAAELLEAFPGLEEADIQEARDFASWRSRSTEEVPPPPER